MNSDKLAIERAAWAVKLKLEFTKNGYTFREHFNDYQTLFVISRPDTPRWQAVVKICSAHRLRNRIEINSSSVAHSIKASGLRSVMGMLDTVRQMYLADVAKNADREAAAAKWHERQDQELAGLPELKGIEAEIIKTGAFAGCYAITLQPGNSLEHVTLEQLKAFYKFIVSLNE